MGGKTVEKLEERIEEAVAQVIGKMGLKKLPLQRSRYAIQIMAKVAVAVHKATGENQWWEE